MARRVLIIGAGGQLGRHLSEFLTARKWLTIGADIAPASAKAPVTHAIHLERNWSPEEQGEHLLSSLVKLLGSPNSDSQQLDAVVNVAGGFTMGNAADPDVVKRTRTMVESSLYSSVMAAQVSSQVLRPGGLLVLPGAAAALSPTGWSLPYGAAKAAVHHLVRSLADVGSAGLPAGVKTIGLAPIILDTPQNREAMPDADRSTWTTLDEMSEQLEAWCADPAPVESGRVYVVEKAAGAPSTFTAMAPF